MRFPLLSLFVTSPFEGIQEHAEKVKECAFAFQQAVECHISHDCHTFEDFRKEISKLENDADAIKRRIRGHLPKGTLMPVDKFQLFRYLREQDHVLDGVKDSLNWISYRPEPGIPDFLAKDFLKLTDAVIQPIVDLSKMVAEARIYFKNFNEKQRRIVKDIIRTIREQEAYADKIEAELKMKIFSTFDDSATVFHMIRLVEILGSIADHAENTGDMMRAMMAR
ncbi:TIGR00153 family protein [Desulfobacterales bacterium HSG16]|nr:TIGR00153 family protein [Desulfobacterales bacterium HSG16]